jgi:hypothetical protein
MFHAHEWWYRTASKTLEDVPDVEREERIENAAVVFFHVEAEDESELRRTSVLQKFVKNIKWLAGKFNTRNVVLHSFNHLSSSKSSPDFALSLVDSVEERLIQNGFTVMRTPFGYFNEFKIHVGGESLAKVFKEL